MPEFLDPAMLKTKNKVTVKSINESYLSKLTNFKESHILHRILVVHLQTHTTSFNNGMKATIIKFCSILHCLFLSQLVALSPVTNSLKGCKAKAYLEAESFPSEIENTSIN